MKHCQKDLQFVGLMALTASGVLVLSITSAACAIATSYL